MQCSAASGTSRMFAMASMPSHKGGGPKTNRVHRGSRRTLVADQAGRTQGSYRAGHHAQLDPSGVWAAIGAHADHGRIRVTSDERQLIIEHVSAVAIWRRGQRMAS
jgi:hypothetical protein